MPRRPAQIIAGLALVAIGVYLVFSPLAVAGALHRPHDTSTQMINLRASWGGTLTGLGAFVAWLPAPRPWMRALLGLLLATMAGIGSARAIGFVLDGHPDSLQWVWMIAEVAIVVVCATLLRSRARAQQPAEAEVRTDR